jgi:hypothetical protein
MERWTSADIKVELYGLDEPLAQEMCLPLNIRQLVDNAADNERRTKQI